MDFSLNTSFDTINRNSCGGCAHSTDFTMLVISPSLLFEKGGEKYLI
jgi:hypothetical protein